MHELTIQQKAQQTLSKVRKTLLLSEQNLKKNEHIQNEMLEQNRRITAALVHLLPAQSRPEMLEGDASISQRMQHTQDTCTQLADREAFDVVHTINVLAMANADILACNVTFKSLLCLFSLEVFKAKSEKLGESTKLFSAQVFLDCPDALNQMLEIESQLTELVIHERDAEQMVRMQ